MTRLFPSAALSYLNVLAQVAVVIFMFTVGYELPWPSRRGQGRLPLLIAPAALLVPLTEGRTLGWPVWTWVVLALAPVLALAAVRNAHRTERRGHLPLLPPSLLKVRSMRRGLIFGLPFFLGFGAFMFVFALTVQDGLHQSALASGLVILPLAVAFLGGSLLTPKIIERIGRATLGWGALLQTLGLVWLAWTVAGQWPHVALLDTAGPLVVCGVGQAMVFGSLFRLVLADVPPQLGGIGGGVLITLQQSGLALGVATLGTLYLSLSETDIGTAFGTVVGIQAGLALVLALGSRTLPQLTPAAAAAVALE